MYNLLIIFYYLGQKRIWNKKINWITIYWTKKKYKKYIKSSHGAFPRAQYRIISILHFITLYIKRMNFQKLKKNNFRKIK